MAGSMQTPPAWNDCMSQSRFNGVETNAHAEGFWSKYFDGFEPARFPCVSGLRKEATSSLITSTSIIGAQSHDRLLQVSRDLGIVPEAPIQLCWALILSCYLGANTRDVAFGTLTTRHVKLSLDEPLNSSVVPVRVDFSALKSSTANVELLRQLCTRYEQSIAISDLASDGESIGRPDSFYDTLIAFSHEDVGQYLHTKARSLFARFDMAVLVEIGKAGSGDVQYHVSFTNRYLSHSAASIMLRQLDGLLHWVLSYPSTSFDKHVGSLSASLLSTSNVSPPQRFGSSSPVLLHSQFEDHALQRPDDIALSYVHESEDGQLSLVGYTYSSLDFHSTKLANKLRCKLGKLPHKIVPILMDKSPELYIAILAVLKAGAAWCPIDTLSPPERQRSLVARAESSVLLTDHKHALDWREVEGIDAYAVEEGNLLFMSPDQKLALSDEFDYGPELDQIVEDSPAYLIWTSGTTGPPKGVVVSHKAAVASMTALQESIPSNKAGNSIRCMQFSQHTFDVFVQDLFYTWGLGGTLVSASRELMSTSFPSVAMFAEATHAHLTPAFAASIPRSSCPTLQVVTMIGEKLPQHVADDWGYKMIAFNTYGPAECAVVSTLRQFTGKDDSTKSSNIGQPLRSVSCYVVQKGFVAMRNVVGELVLGGQQLADGYWKDSGKTSDRFIHVEGIGERVYKTGDIVRMLADGSLEFIGREDDLVKLQGIRVELSEISFALKSCHPLAEQVETCFFDRADRPSKVVVTFIAIKRPELATGDQLVIFDHFAIEIATAAIEAAQNSLPEYMVPSTVLVVRKIPRTASAKLDSRILQAAYEDADLAHWELNIHKIGREDSGGKLTEQDLKVMEAITSTTGVQLETIKKSSYLPALGVDSITSAKLATVMKSLGIPIKVVDVLRCRTVNDLLVYARREHRENDPFSVEQAAAEFSDHWLTLIQDKLSTRVSLVLPASMLQESLLAETLDEPLAYWNSHVYSMPLDTDLDRLKNAWSEVSVSNEAMRTTFLAAAEIETEMPSSKINCTFFQIIHPTWLPNWTVIEVEQEDVSSFSQRRAHDVARQSFKEGFKRPPWSVSIFRGKTLKHITMMINIHHALIDETSYQFLMQDVWTSYSNLQPVRQRTQLRDIVTKVNSPFKKHQDHDVKFWQQHLGGIAEYGEVQLPDLRSAGDHSTTGSRRAMISTHLEVEIAEKSLQDAARIFLATPAALFRAAWGQIILQYLEVPKVVIGEVVSERLFHPDLADAIGPMLSVVPVAIQSFSNAHDFLRESEKMNPALRDHRHVPTTALRKLVGRPKSQPLYPALFNFIPSQGENDCPWIEIKDLISIHVEHTLALNVQKLCNTHHWMLEAFGDATIIDKEHLQVICKQVATLVQKTMDHPDKPKSSILDASTPDTISVAKSKLPVSFASGLKTDPTFWISAHAEEHPGWVAVEVASAIAYRDTSTATWEFKTLNQMSNQVAVFLVDCGLRQRTVAMCISRSLISYAVVIGILRSGNIYLPIDEGLPQDRKQFLLEDSNTSLLFTDSTCAESFTHIPGTCRAIYLDKKETVRLISKCDNSKRLSLAVPEEDAYLLYTSGSTGAPKGVRISHKNLCGFVEGLADFIGSCSPATHKLGGRGKFLGLASRAFDVHLCEMFLSWRLGLRAATAPREVLLDDIRLALTELKITHACFVPTLLDQAEVLPHEVPDLVYFSVGGEKISQRIIDVWGSQDRTLVINAYGPTEVTIGCCASRVTSRSNVRNIGRPFGNTTAHVLLSEGLNYAILGQPGELCITGDLVGNGYFNRPEVKGFVEDYGGQRMYRTGDIVRMKSDGSLDYLGRRDDQTKIRGQRIELSEVNECIKRNLETATDVATLVLQHPRRGQSQLVSFLAPISERPQRYGATPRVAVNTGLVVANVRAICRRRLPTFMVPDYIIPTSVIPLALISGKADTKLLKTFYCSLSISDLLTINSESSERTESSRNLTESELLVREVISDTFNVEAGSMSHLTNLFDMGIIDSLSAITLSVKLRKAGFDCNNRAIFSCPTIKKLALLPKLLREADQFSKLLQTGSDHLKAFDKSVRSMSQTDLGSFEVIRPCLPLQEGVVARSLNGTSHFPYINHFLLRLEDNVSLPHLEGAWISVVKHTQILRTCFRQVGADIAQFVLLPQFTSIRWFELSDLLSQDESRVALQSARFKASEDIMNNIESLPPVVFNVLKCVDHTFLTVSIHHALYDAVSFNFIMNDVRDTYFVQTAKQRLPFDHLLNFVSAQDESRQKAFWTRYLDGIAASRYAFESGNAQTVTGERCLSLSLSKLRSLASKFEATVSVLCQCCFGIILSQLLGRQDVVFGVVLSGRVMPALDLGSVIGPCLTTIPQTIRLSNGRDTLAQTISKAQSSMLESLEFQHTSLRKIHRWIHAEKQIFDCLFQYLGELEEPSRYSELWHQEQSTMEPDYPLAIELEPNSHTDRVTVRVSAKSNPHAGDDVEYLYQKLDFLVAALYDNRDLRVDEINIEKRGLRVDDTENVALDDSSYMKEASIIKDIVSEVCDIDTSQITISAPFFQMGIDSVTAISFSRRLRDAGLNVRPRDVMKYQCIGRLCENLYSNTKVASEGSLGRNEVQINKMTSRYVDKIRLLDVSDDIEAAYPCMPLQNGMLTATLASDGAMYIHQHILKLNNSLDVTKLESAWQSLVEAIDIFRTSFHLYEESSSYWFAGVHKRSPAIHVKTANADSLGDFVRNVAEKMVLSSKTAFEKPPIQAYVVHVLATRYFILSLHHSLYDGISLPLLFHNLALAYRGHKIHRWPQFYKVAIINSQQESQSEGFWLKTLEGYENKSATLLPPAQVDSMIYNEWLYPFDLDSTLRGVKNLGVTLQTAALVAFGKTIAGVLERRDVVFGHVIAGRNLQLDGCESIIGPLFNTVPMRIKFDKLLKSNEEYLQELQAFTGESQDHAHASLLKVQQAWRARSNSLAFRLIEALFLFQKFDSNDLPDQDLWQTVDVDLGIARSEYSLNFEVEQRNDRLVFKASCRESFMSKERLYAFGSQFGEVIKNLVDQPKQGLVAFPEGLLSLPLTGLDVFRDGSDKPDRALEHDPKVDLLRRILAQESGVPYDEVSRNTSIFTMGLDSISAIKIASACRTQGLELGSGDIIQGQTPCGILRLHQARNSRPSFGEREVDISSKELDLDFLKPGDIGTVLPCLSGQIYHLSNFFSGGYSMHYPTFAYQCKKPVDHVRLRRAWDEMRSNWSILRTTFATSSKHGIVQVILKAATNDLEVVEPGSAIDDVFLRRQIVLWSHRIIPSRDPPVRLILLKGSHEDTILITLHHALYDAWSIHMMLSDLENIYHGRGFNPRPDFSEYTRHTLRNRFSTDSKSYWQHLLQGCQRSLLTRPPKAPISNPINPAFVSLPSSLKNLSLLQKTTQRRTLSLTSIILLSFARLLARTTKTSNPTFGHFHLGRSSSFPDVSRVPGPCLNVLPLMVHNALTVDPVEAAQAIQADLASRVEREQDDLSEVLGWVDEIRHREEGEETSNETDPQDNNKDDTVKMKPESEPRYGPSESTPLFNAYINILPPPPPPPSTSTSARAHSHSSSDPSKEREPNSDRELKTEIETETETETEIDSPLFAPIPTDDPTFTIAAEESPTSPSPNTANQLPKPNLPLAKEALYLDVVLSADGESADLAARVEGGLMGRQELKAWLEGLVAEVEGLRRELGVKVKEEEGR